jgi:transcription antitermination factor NusA-like protein
MTTNPEIQEINTNSAELQKSLESKTKPILDQNNNESDTSKMADTKLNTELPQAQVEASGDVEAQMKMLDDLKIVDTTEKDQKLEAESESPKSEDQNPETTENSQPEDPKSQKSDDAKTENPKSENPESENPKSETQKSETPKSEDAKSDANSEPESDKKDDKTKPLLTNAKLPQYAPNYHTRPQNQHFHQQNSHHSTHHQHFAHQNSAHTQFIPHQFHQSGQSGHQQQHHHHHHNHAFSRSDKTTVRFLIPAKAAGAIIGKGGANIKELREQYQALIAIPDAATPERVVRIQLQDTQKMIEVVQKISELLKDDILKFRRSKNSSQSGTTNNQVNHPFNGEENTEMRMLVHQSQAGAIIGPKGSHVKRINEETGAKINVQTEICPHSTDKVAQITGTPDAISKAVGEIQCVLGPEKVWC